MKSYGSQNDEVSQLTEMFNLDFNELPQEHFSVYEIETFKRNGILVPISIAVSSTLAGPMYFERSSDKPEDGYKMVTEFMNYLQYLQRLLMEQLPDEIHEVIENLQRFKDDPGQYNQSDEGEYCKKKRTNHLYNYVSNYRCLKVFGFNARKVFIYNVHMCTHTYLTHHKSKFDLPILLPYISRWAEARHINITLMKKGTKITHLSMSEVGEYDFAQWRDTLSYTSPCSLDSFLKQWNAPQAKGCFPHE